MPIQVSCYGGRIGWKLKKWFPRLASEIYIRTNFFLRRKYSQKYIEWFLGETNVPPPLQVNIETINRCNSTCSFCPANKNDDKRPFAKMSEETFYKIIGDLREWNYQGIVSLYVNNEPFIDNRIISFYKYAREQLPDCKLKLFTNGLLMDKEKFKEIIPYVDYVTINNYGETMKLHHSVEEIVTYVRTCENDYQDKSIKVNIRYIKDILTNRAGEAPNKKANSKVISEPCLFPYTDLTIFSNGNVGLCCNDATEKTNLGNVMAEGVQQLWELEGQGTRYATIRNQIAGGRNTLEFCKYCDTLDSGSRVKIIGRIKSGKE